MGSLDTQTSMDFDVCIIGAGPVGAYLAVRLAREGVSVGLFEQTFTPSDEPRAVVHMPMLFAPYADIDVLDQMKKASGIHTGSIAYRRTSDSEIVEEIAPNPNRPGPLACPQGIFVQMLFDKLENFPTGKVFMGHQVLEVQEDENGCSLQIEDIKNKATIQARCRYLVGADGSKSVVRKAMGLRYEGTTLPFKLIAANVVFPFENYGYDGANYMLDPVDFGLIAHIGSVKDGRLLYRVSVTFPIDMSDEDIMANMANKFERLCKHMKPGTYEVLTAAPYAANQFCVPTMLKGHTMLIGDAGHLCNPYAGQSMAFGIFDASALAECLVPILKQSASPSLLEEWNQDRVHKVLNILLPLSQACFNAVRDPDTASIGQRFPILKAMKAGPAAMAKMPTLVSDVTKYKGWSQTDAPQVSVQNGSQNNAEKTSEKIDMIRPEA